MTLSDRGDGRAVLWDGLSPACDVLRDLLQPVAPSGTLRLVVQRLRLREPAGEHEIIDAIVDVDGNLVAIALREAVRADAESARGLDAALATLRADIEEGPDGIRGVEGLEVVLDADGRTAVGLAFDLDLSADEIASTGSHPALHDGAHHVRHSAPQLEDLRERLAPPEPGVLRRLWEALRARRGRAVAAD
ncbi:hypothetical protein ACXET9_11125 [Brachybacterium sp. DNPG3]